MLQEVDLQRHELEKTKAQVDFEVKAADCEGMAQPVDSEFMAPKCERSVGGDQEVTTAAPIPTPVRSSVATGRIETRVHNDHRDAPEGTSQHDQEKAMPTDAIYTAETIPGHIGEERDGFGLGMDSPRSDSLAPTAPDMDPYTFIDDLPMESLDTSMAVTEEEAWPKI